MERKNESFEIEYEGKIYNGYRLIVKTDKYRQTVFYGGERKYDAHGLRDGEDALGENMAKVLLRELVEESIAKKRE